MAENSKIEWTDHKKRGVTIASNGYILIRVGRNHHLADVRGYAYEHRLVAEQKIGRRLNAGEQVHHIDGNTQNNLPENLEVAASLAHHRVLHRRRNKGLRTPGEENALIFCACGCGKSLTRFDASGRPRSFVSCHNPPDTPRTSALIDILRGGSKTASEISAGLGGSTGSVKSLLSKLTRLEIIRRTGRGIYQLP